VSHLVAKIWNKILI